ncbi:MAG: hypothetical protein KatS3mg104_1136 [Phycisphaerae bacterium]|mgnify:CR=1 FL=1|nr:MAG: hypothetical protein KatS3mg104_1136 [Phycisphaerae bacterium]
MILRVTDPLFLKSVRFHHRRVAVGLSGGADSTCLAWLGHQAKLDTLILVHVNHELRGEESEADQTFCINLARHIDRPIVVIRRSQIEPTLSDLPANPSARYRMIRLSAFQKVVNEYDLESVCLAHHADDQAETVFLRLMRGGSPYACRGMRPMTTIGSLILERPLLQINALQIRDYLTRIGQSWREDSSNRSERYRRNQVRKILNRFPELSPLLLELAQQAQDHLQALDAVTPFLPDRFACGQLADLPDLIAEHAARRWLIAHQAPPDDVSVRVCHRLIRQASDPLSPHCQHYPGGILVRRRKNHLDVVSSDYDYGQNQTKPTQNL